tara:strand:- start:3554 stop:4930 length:1377 start_codon:yes stop_codon:yes gene_type:complete
MALDFEKLLKFYARKDIQQVILDLAEDREIAVRYGDGGYGRRPDVLQYNSDIMELARKGVTSFHVSEERWHNPLQIVTGMPRKELDSIRSGWDCVLDIDSAYFEYSQITTHLLLEALKFYGIKSCGVKFSGRKGFHIIIPFEAFPSEVGGKPIKSMFPEGPRMIADFLGNMIFNKLSERILAEQKIEEIAKLTGKDMGSLMLDGKFNPFSVVDIDTILIASRHLFRSVYSINEKSGLASIPVNSSEIMNFKLRRAKMENVDTEITFFKKAIEPGEAKSLAMQAFDNPIGSSKLKKRSTIIVKGKDYFAKENNFDFKAEPLDNKLVREDYYPPCMKLLLGGIKEDGRKRALFALMNFFKSLNYSSETIRQKINEWNEKNSEPLREGYVISQLNSMLRSRVFLPPNCENEGYYKALGVCKPNNLCQRIKNPLNYTLLNIRIENQNKRKKKTLKRKVSSKK